MKSIILFFLGAKIRTVFYPNQCIDWKKPIRLAKTNTFVAILTIDMIRFLLIFAVQIQIENA